MTVCNWTSQHWPGHLQPYVDSGHLNKWAIPRPLSCVDEIPKTSVGKIDKKRIRQAEI
nr:MULTISPECIES: hypothetical protein [Pseudomonas]